ncbi:MAG: mechanosensitive ion channel family protein [Anaerolineae bacterium]|nr:mechanosensitive ion channel family protein [Anaerolineae bacterium]
MTWWDRMLATIWPNWVLRILALVAVWAVAWWLVRYLGRWLRRASSRVEGAELDERELWLVDRVLDAAVIIVALLVTAYLLNLTGLLYSILTAAGVLGVAVGFAVKDVVANFVSGIFLILDQTLVVGDSVKAGGYSGTVKRQTLRTTEIETVDGPVVTLPNSILATSAVVNYSVAERRRVNLPFAVMADQDLARAASVLLETAQADARVLQDPAPRVVFGEIRDRTVELVLVAYSAPGDWSQLTSDLRAAVLEAFGKAGVELAMPILKNL